MDYLRARSFIIKQNLLVIIGICLFCYFSWHIVTGKRSYTRLVYLNNNIEKISEEYNRMHEERIEIENKVVKLRPGSIDPDLLEERARYVLGYVHPDDYMLIRSN
jgi:cell division protein FtsB